MATWVLSTLLLARSAIFVDTLLFRKSLIGWKLCRLKILHWLEILGNDDDNASAICVVCWDIFVLEVLDRLEIILTALFLLVWVEICFKEEFWGKRWRFIHTCDMTYSHVRYDLSGHTCDWAILHMWLSHITHVNESYHTCAWVMSHMWMSHVTHVNESYRTCEWVMSHMWMSHVAHVNESCHTCAWVLSHMWMSHITHVNESYHTCEWVMSRMRGKVAHVTYWFVNTSRVRFIHVCLIDMGDITHSHVCDVTHSHI